MRVRVNEIHGIQSQTAAKLKSMGIVHSDHLLAAAGQPKERQMLATKLGVDARYLLELTNRADLSRIKGVGKVYADVLETAGVDSVIELATRRAENLYIKVAEISVHQGIRRIPKIDEVRDWIEQAKQLDRKVYH